MTRTVNGLAERAEDQWVEAAPFRAHLRHLMSVSGMSSSCVALLAGVSPRLAFHLLHGRRGRPLKRISPDTARKLLRVSAGEARAVCRRTVPAHDTVQHLQRLLAAGCSPAALADRLGVSCADLSDLLGGTRSSCTQRTALRAAAEVTLLQRQLPSRAAAERRAA